jgi:hypothetical protein
MVIRTAGYIRAKNIRVVFLQDMRIVVAVIVRTTCAFIAARILIAGIAYKLIAERRARILRQHLRITAVIVDRARRAAAFFFVDIAARRASTEDLFRLVLQHMCDVRAFIRFARRKLFAARGMILISALLANT